MSEMAECPYCGEPHVTVPDAIGTYYSVCKSYSTHEIIVEVTKDADGTRRVNIQNVEKSSLPPLPVVLAVFLGIPAFWAVTYAVDIFNEEEVIMKMLIVCLFFGFASILLLIPFGKGYNKLSRLLNQVSKHKSKVVTTLARRGIAVDDLHRLATNAG